MEKRNSRAMSRLGALSALAVVLAIVVAVPALAGSGNTGSNADGGGGGTSGALFSTVNPAVDGTGHCQQGNQLNNCNTYASKFYVWINGGPKANQLLPDGDYYFVVTEPGGPGEKNPVDDSTMLKDQVPVNKTDKNLSDDFDTWQNRRFTVTGGEISDYQGTHDYKPDTTLVPPQNKIRLFPYSTTQNMGGNYNVWICQVVNGAQGPTSGCKNDHFKVPGADRTPPECPRPKFFIENGQRKVTQTFTDSGLPASQYGGIENLVVQKALNVNWEISPFFAATTYPITVTGTVIDPSQPSGLQILVYDVAGNVTLCDPALATLKLNRGGVASRTLRGFTRRERAITLTNESSSAMKVRFSVNGARSRVVTVAAHSRKVLTFRRTLKKKGNAVLVQARGAQGARLRVMVSN